jgi:hypothetical protein
MFTYPLVILLRFSLAFPVIATSAEVYVWPDENDVLVFSDSPRAGAEKVILKPESAVIPALNIEFSLLDNKPKEIGVHYEVDITQPKNNTTIRDNNGSVYISGAINPTFQQGFKIQLYIDGKAHLRPQTHPVFSLKGIYRGEHQIKMDLIDQEGKVIASSNLTTFYMHRASVN